MGFEQDFADGLDHVAKIGRPAMDESDTSKTFAVASMSVVETAAPFGIQEISGDRVLRDIGLIDKATHKGFTGANRDVKEGDVIQPTSGNEAGKFFKVGRIQKRSLTGSAQMVLEESAAEQQWHATNNW